MSETIRNVLWSTCPRCKATGNQACKRKMLNGKLIKRRTFHRERNRVINPHQFESIDL